MRLPRTVALGRGQRAATIGAVVLLVVLGLLSGVVNARLLAVSDSRLLTIAQTPASLPLDFVMVVIALLGSVEVTGGVMAALVATALLRHRRFSIDLLAPVAFLLVASIIEVAGKLIIHQPSPPATLVRGPRFGVGVSPPYSFPSGHMVRATFVYGLVALRLDGRFRSAWWPWLCVLLVSTIGFSRVYLGNHWPADVAGGILLGGAALGLTLALAPRASLGEDIDT
jgi:membrane-associated phospholipid phosphatase